MSLTILTLAVTLWLRKRKVEPPTIAVSAALLFALPAIRNTQPGVPVIGCTADAVGFFWNMAITSIALLLLMWNYIIKYKKDKHDPFDGSMGRSPSSTGSTTSTMRETKPVKIADLDRLHVRTYRV